MKTIDLSQYGICAKQIIHNPSYEVLFTEETAPELTGYESAKITDSGATAVMTGIYTGRAPKDRFFVLDDVSRDTINWDSPQFPNDNRPISEKSWNVLKELALDELNHKKLFVIDAFCGADPATRLKVRFIVEVAWQAHFVMNMFIRPTTEELENFGEPDFLVLTASKCPVNNWKELGLHSETAIVFNLKEKVQIILNTWYGGEMKKGLFSVMNWINPLRGIASMHCSANCSLDGKNTAIFFGLSGTGKTTLSTDPKRLLVGDDEHGWDDEGVFNYEGGCYAKVIDLDKESEPDIYNAIRRNALLENVVVKEDGSVDYTDKSITENTRVSYPIDHIDNIVKPVSRGPDANEIIYLSADAYGVLPPVSILTREQAQYYFLSGYTSKLAGTELGVTEPQPTFSSCFGAAFLSLHPFTYAKVLSDKIEKADSKIYLVNTGWNGTGKRISIKDTRAIIDSILSGSILNAPTQQIPYFNLTIPTDIPGVDSSILDPRHTYKNPEEWEKRAKQLAEQFISNFKKISISNQDCVALESVGPHL